MSWFKAGQRSQEGVPAGVQLAMELGLTVGVNVEGAKATDTTTTATTTQKGNTGEALALRHLQRQGLRLIVRNYRVARGPRAPAGEVDLVMQDTDGTLVFVEVRSRSSASRGGAAASVGWVKQQRLQRAAQHFLQRLARVPPCRFDVVAIDGDTVQWLRAAFDAQVR
jgi:putative endonuclease